LEFAPGVADDPCGTRLLRPLEFDVAGVRSRRLVLARLGLFFGHGRGGSRLASGCLYASRAGGGLLDRIGETVAQVVPEVRAEDAHGEAERGREQQGIGTDRAEGDHGGEFPTRRITTGDRAADLRYGENPHQDAALYGRPTGEASVVGAPQLNEGTKDLSYNNYNDADAALNLVKEFDRPAAAVIKHTNPAGCATADDLRKAYDRALSTDPMSAYGGVIALNRECDRRTAAAITDSFKELVVAPSYTEDALETLFEKEGLRVLPVGDLDATAGRERLTEKSLVGGRLVQERDDQRPTPADLEVVTGREPTEGQLASLLFAWQTVKHVKSNAILFAKGTETVGIGAGQVSRVDAVEIAGMKAREHAEGKSADGAVMASDAFFPFPDGIEAAAEAGVEAVVQPGGSVNDDDVVVDGAAGLDPMAFTGTRCFRHD